MLPVSYERPESPRVQWSKDNPPIVFDWNDPNIRYIVPAVTAALANKATLSSAKNFVRMFCFNLLSQNHWNNEYFNELFQLTMTHVTWCVRNGARITDYQIEDSAEQMLALFTSSLVFRFNELSPVVPLDERKIHSQNAGLLDNLKMEMSLMTYPVAGNQMYPHPAPQRTSNGWPQDLPPGQYYYGQGGVMVDPRMHPQMHPMGYPQQPGYPQMAYPPQQPMDMGHIHQNQMYHNPHMVHPHAMQGGMQGHPGYPNQQRYRPLPDHRPDPNVRDYGDDERHEREERRPKRLTFSGAPITDDMEDLKQDRYFQLMTEDDEKDDLDPPPPTHTAYEPEGIVMQPQTYDVVTTSNLGGSDMDRSQHELGIPTSVKTMAEKERVEEVLKQDEVDFVVDRHVVADLDIDVPIAQLRMDNIKTQGKSVLQKRVYIPCVLISTVPVQETLKGWLKGETLSQIAENLRDILSNLSGSSSVEKDRAQVALLHELDDKLTMKVNEFIKRKLADLWKPFTIGSFIEDFPDLSMYVMRNIGKTGVDLLRQFDIDLAAMLTTSRLDMFNKEIDESPNMLNIPAGVSVGYLPNTYLVSLVNLNVTELKLVRNFQKQVVNPKTNDFLYRVVSSVFESDETSYFEEDMVVENFMLVTSDGARFAIDRDMSSGTGIVYTVQRV